MRNYYTAEQAREKLGLKQSTFHYLVRKGEIPKENFPLRKQALYPKQKIDELAEGRARLINEYETKPERFAFVIPTREDLEQLIEIERVCYAEETIISPDRILQRSAYNPENIHVLKDIHTNKVVGSITMSPLKSDVLARLINLEIDETHIQPEDYLPYTPNIPLDCYVISIIAEPSVTEKYYGQILLRAILNYLLELLDRGVVIRYIYTVATTKEGEELAQNMHATLLQTNWTGENEMFRHSYLLDLESPDKKSKLVSQYLRKKRNLERRRKRQNQANP